MKVIVAGTRTFDDYDCVKDLLDQLYAIIDIESIVSGVCRRYDENGKELLTPDLMGEMWAKEYSIRIDPYPADWKEYGRYAGPIRNRQMAQIADYAVIFWDGQSKGSRSMIKEMNHLKKPYLVYRYSWNGKKE